MLAAVLRKLCLGLPAIFSIACPRINGRDLLTVLSLLL